MAPAAIICISITPGNTSAMPASASVPRRATKYVSIKPVAACASMTRMLGVASRSRVNTTGPRSNCSVRDAIAAERCTDGSCNRSGRPSVTALMTCAPNVGAMPADRSAGVCSPCAAGPAVKRCAASVIGLLVTRSTRIGSAAFPVTRSTSTMLSPSGAKCLLPQASKAISTGRKSRPRAVGRYS